MYEPLFATITTKEELHHLLVSLDELQERTYSLKTPMLDTLDQLLPYDKKEVFLTLCHKNHVVFENPHSLKQCILDIRKEAKALPVVELSIAYTPTEEHLKELQAWFEAQVGQKYIFEITVDHSIVGGAVVSANGFYKDFTLQRFLRENYKTDI